MIGYPIKGKSKTSIFLQYHIIERRKVSSIFLETSKSTDEADVHYYEVLPLLSASTL